MTPEARARRRIRTPVLAVTACAWVVLLAAGPLASPGGVGSAASPAVAASSGHVHHLVGSTPGGEDGAVGASAGAAGAAGASAGAAGAAGALAGATGPASADRPGASGSGVSVPAFLAGWLVMLTAMMAPHTMAALRHAHARTLPRRRPMTLALVLGAFTATWVGGGLVLLVASTALSIRAGRADLAFAVAVVVAAVWQVSPAKQRCLNRHHTRPPLAAFGWAAGADAIRLGGRHAAWCFGSCWALMLVALLAPGWHVAVMVVVTAWMWAELLDRPRSPAWEVRVPHRAARVARQYARGHQLGRPVAGGA
ncbi:hypothetical protein GCM10023168_11790 [Fodinibacter luteus]|uniref:DUF2182 domain-containing protein n=1 Tax=Fodinibacter luteus TaxID=552064 RepID=A0ABP8K7I6_9MICO